MVKINLYLQNLLKFTNFIQFYIFFKCTKYIRILQHLFIFKKQIYKIYWSLHKRRYWLIKRHLQNLFKFTKFIKIYKIYSSFQNLFKLQNSFKSTSQFYWNWQNLFKFTKYIRVLLKLRVIFFVFCYLYILFYIINHIIFNYILILQPRTGDENYWLLGTQTTPSTLIG